MKTDLNVLLIEDNPYHAAQVESTLADAHLDFAITSCTTSDDAIKALRAGEFDIVLMDSELPDLDGLSLLNLITREGFDKPIIITTGTDREDSAMRAMKDRAYDCVVKDDSYPKVLPFVISQALDRYFAKERNLELEHKLKDSEESDFLSEAAKALSHEINNPLMTIIGNTQLLGSSKYDLAPEVRQKIEAIEVSAFRIREAAARFSEAARAEATKRHASPAC